MYNRYQIADPEQLRELFNNFTFGDNRDEFHVYFHYASREWIVTTTADLSHVMADSIF